MDNQPLDDHYQDSDPLSDLHADLHGLIAVWETARLAADTEARQQRVGDLRSAYFHQGVGQTYERVIAALYSLLAGNSSEDNAMTDAPTYRPLSQADAAALLAGVGLHPSTLTHHADGALTAIFQRVSAQTQEARRAALASIVLPGLRARIVVLDTGRLRDTGEPYIDFALVEE